MISMMMIIEYFKEAGVATRVELLQKSQLLGTATALRMVLES